jgi:hypothetical protein
MKRLIVYLFIFFGFGLTFSVNSHSSVYCVDNKINERIENFKPDYLKRENEFFYFSAQSGACIGSYTQVTYEQYNYFKRIFILKSEVKLSDFNDKHFEKLLEKDNMNLYPNTKKLLNELIINLTKYENTIKTDYNPEIKNLLNKINENKEYTLTNNDFVNLKILESDFANISNENNELYLIKRSKFLKDKDIQPAIDRGDKGLVLARLIQFLQTEDKLENIDGDTVYFIIKTLNPFNKIASINYLRNKILLNFFETKDTKIAKKEPNLKAEKYVCSIWQASSFQIVDRVNDLSRCNDLYYENSDSENYQLFSRYSNTILSNETYANLKKKIKNGVSFNVNAAETEGCKKGNCRNGQGTYTFANGNKYVGEWKDNKKHGQGTLTFAGGEKYVGEFKYDKYYGQGTYTWANGNKYVGEFKDSKYYGQGTYTFANGNKYVGEFKDNQKNGQGTLTYVDGSYCTGIFENDKCLSDIVKADPNKNKPKKKVEVAKVEEPKKEEFKPKSTNQDKDPPVIQISETITVNNSDYTIEGKVSDKADRVFIEVDGQTIVADKGKFKIQRFSPIDEQIQIVAIDQWGNRSKPKTVNIKLDIKSTETALLIEKLNPTKI